MELYIWSGDSKRGLASVDLESLQILTYVKFSNAPVTVHKKSSPHLSPSGALPAFICDNGIYSKFSEIIMFLRRKNFCCDYELSAGQCADALAYKNMLLDKLHPAVIYLQWAEPQTYFEITRKWYFENVSFPYKFWVPSQYYKQNKEYIAAISNEDMEPAAMQLQILAEAITGLNLLSDKLTEHEYFFGRNPSTLDACIYSYLVILLKCGAKVNELRNRIESSPSLLHFVENVNKKHFPIAKQEPPKDLSGFQGKTRNLVLSALIASTAMFGYGVAAGLVQVDMNYLKDVEVNDDGTECG